MEDKKQVTLAEMREIQLHLMDCIHDYCTTHGLRYSLGGGTLLGAIRHSGFIPWDDDVDIMLPRKDYDELLRGFDGAYEHCYLQYYDKDKDFPLLYAKACDDRTVLKEKYHTSGVFVDVFPIDGMGDESKLAEYYEAKRKAFHGWSVYTKPWLKQHWKTKLLRLVTPPKPYIKKRIDAFLKSYDFETSECTGCVMGSYLEMEQMWNESFKNYIDVEFEGRTYKAIADYDRYLTRHYGNYMQYPPEEERKSHHEFECWWK